MCFYWFISFHLSGSGSKLTSKVMHQSVVITLFIKTFLDPNEVKIKVLSQGGPLISSLMSLSKIGDLEVSHRQTEWRKPAEDRDRGSHNATTSPDIKGFPSITQNLKKWEKSFSPVFKAGTWVRWHVDLELCWFTLKKIEWQQTK